MHSLGYPLTPGPNGTAKLASTLAQAARERNRKARAELIVLGQQASNTPLLINATVNRQLNLVREQIALTRKTLNDTNHHYCEECERGGIDGKERAALIRALNDLMDHECRLLGIGEPARCRPANEPTRVTRRLDPPVVDVSCVPQVQDQPGSTPPVGVQPIQDKQ